MDDVFTLQQLADRWQCSPQTIRSAINYGEIPYFKIGRMIRVSKKVVIDHERRTYPMPPFGYRTWRGKATNACLDRVSERIGADDVLSKIDALMDWRAFCRSLSMVWGDPVTAHRLMIR